MVAVSITNDEWLTIAATVAVCFVVAFGLAILFSSPERKRKRK